MNTNNDKQTLTRFVALLLAEMQETEEERQIYKKKRLQEKEAKDKLDSELTEELGIDMRRLNN